MRAARPPRRGHPTADLKQAVQRQFGDVTHHYAASTVFSQGVDLQAIEREAAELRPDVALDVGTAAGHVAFALAPHAGQVVGLDLTHAMLVKARERAVANLRLCQADVEHLPFPDHTFDLLTCRFSGHHFPNPARFAAEAARVLRPDGRILLADVVAPPEPGLDAWINEVERLRDPSHVRDHSAAEWQRLFADAGLRSELVLDWRLDLDFDDWIRRQRTPPERVAELRGLFLAAPPSHRAAFALHTPDAGPWSFRLHCAVLRAALP